MNAMIWVENWPALNRTTAEWTAITDKLEARAKDRGDTVLGRDDHRIVLETTRSYSKFIRSYGNIAPYGLYCLDTAYHRKVNHGYIAVKAMIAQGCADTVSLGWHGMDQADTQDLTYDGITLDIKHDVVVCPKLAYVSQAPYLMSHVDFNFWHELHEDGMRPILAYQDLAVQCRYAYQIFRTLRGEICNERPREYADGEIFIGIKTVLKDARRNLKIWVRTPYATSDVEKIAERLIFREGRSTLRYFHRKKQGADASADL